MTIWKTKQGTEIFGLNCRGIHCYFFNKNGHSFLVDSGRAWSSDFIRKKLSLISNGEGPGYLIQTHTHFDHSGNTAMIRKEFQSRVMVHAREADHLERGDAPLPEGINLPTRLIIGLGRSLPRLIRFPGVKADIIIHEDEFRMPGIEGLVLMHTPGHSPGSLSVVIDNDIALTGDCTMYGTFSTTAYPPFLMDHSVLMQSWKKLLATGCRIFLSGHGKPISRQKLEKDLIKKTY